MSQGFATFLLMNNYFHDVATAMLLACGIAVRVVLRRMEGNDASVRAYGVRIAEGINRIAWFSVAWIIISGVPRVLTFSVFEWANAVEKHHEAGLIVKYLVAAVMMAVGAYLWIIMLRRVRKAAIPDRSAVL